MQDSKSVGVVTPQYVTIDKPLQLKSGLLLVLQGFLGLHATTIEYETTVSKKPRATPLARYQAGQPDSVRVTSLWKQSVTIDPFTRKLLTLLDGKNDMPTLVKKLKEGVRAGELHVNQHGKPVTDDKQLEKILGDHTQAMLPKLARLALLEG